MKDQPRRIAFFGHFGSLNSGNESTLMSILAHLRERFPQARFLCICTNPAAVSEREGIDAVPITTRVRTAEHGNGSPSARALFMLMRPAAELVRYLEAFRALASTDVLIVPGTGLVTDAFGVTGWGPANLFKWVLVARLRRVRVVFVSIGAGPLDSRRGRILAKAALHLADYRSYRDEASRDYLASMGFPVRRDPVYPDLVFGLPAALLPQAMTPERSSRRRVVGLGLMLYPGRYSTADPQLHTGDAYVRAMAQFASWLLQEGYDIRLLLGDGDGDPDVVRQFTAELSSITGTYDQARVIYRPLVAVADLLSVLAETDIVVATRFHNVLLSFLLDKPVIAISFHHKCTSLMAQMMLSPYCNDIHGIDVDALIEQFRRMEAESDEVRATISRGVASARAALTEQYDLILQPR